MLDKHFFACDKQKMFQEAKCACEAMFVVVAKRASMFDEQSSKFLANSVCPFGQGLIV